MGTPLEELRLTRRFLPEITLGESMRVRCRGRVLRVTRPAAPPQGQIETKVGVAVKFDGYEYLPAAHEGISTFARVSGVPEDRAAEPTRIHAAVRPVLG